MIADVLGMFFGININFTKIYQSFVVNVLHIKSNEISLPVRGGSTLSGPVLLNSFTNDDRGAASLEFGLVVVPLIFTLLLTLYLALFLFVQTALTNIVTVEARRMLTGQQAEQDIYYRSDWLKGRMFNYEAQKLLPSGLPREFLSVRVSSADSMEDLYPPSAWLDKFYYRLGGPSSYVIIVATYDLPFMKSLAAIFHLPSTVSATTLLRLEPYDS